MNHKGKAVRFLVVFGITFLITSSFFEVTKSETPQAKFNGLTIALDTLRYTDTPQVIVNFMTQYHYNELRIFMGWCSSFWTNDTNSPMKITTQRYVDELCRLCAQNGFSVVCAVSAQVTPWKTFAPEELQVGPNGELNSEGNWVCPTGPKFQNFTKNLITTLIGIMEKYATPRISVDEMVFVNAAGRPTFYSSSMQTLYNQSTGKPVPVFNSTYVRYNTEQQEFIEFAEETIHDFYLMMRDTAKLKNPNTLFQALVDTYWVFPRTSYDTEPWDFYASTNLDEITYEWFYAIQTSNWAGITNGLQRIKNLNPTAKHFFIYGTSWSTNITNMRYAVQLAINEGYDGVSLYEYAKSKNNPFDVSGIVNGTEQVNRVFLTVASSSGGSTSPVPGVYEVEENSVFSVNATSDVGYYLNWTLDGVSAGSDNSLLVTIDTNHTLLAQFTPIPTVDQVFLTVNATGGGSTDPVPGVYEVDQNSVLRVNATADVGYYLNWTLDGVNAGSDSPLLVTMDANHTLLAQFTPIPSVDKVFLTVDATAGGSTSPAPGIHEVDQNSIFRVNATADVGYYLNWTLDGVSIGSDNSVLVTVDTNHTLLAKFTPIPTVNKVTLTIEASSGGRTNPVPGEYEVDQNTVYSVNAIPDVGYYLNWTLDGVSVGSGTSLLVTMDRNHTLLAQFTAIPSVDKVFLRLDATEGGSTDPVSGVYEVDQNSVFRVNATVEVGYYLNWTLDGISVGSDNPLFVTMDTNHTLLAQFTPVPTVNKVFLTIDATIGGSTSPIPGVYEVDENTVFLVNATSDVGYYLNWTLDGLSAGSENSMSVTIDTNHTLFAEFTPLPTANKVTLTIEATSGGSTSPVPGAYQVDQNTGYSVNATPDVGYYLNWTLDGTSVGSDNRLLVTMDKNHTLLAQFTLISNSNLFEDGFESGNTEYWSGTTRSSGETLNIGSYSPHHGVYNARFTTNGLSSGYENSYLYKTVDLQDAYARGYFRLGTSSRILKDNGDCFYLIRFSGDGQSLAMAGIGREGGANKWMLTVGGTSKMASLTVAANRWYSVELHLNAPLGMVEMFVNGVKILELAIDNGSSISVDRADFGIISATNVQNGLRVYGDCFRVSNRYNGLE